MYCSVQIFKSIAKSMNGSDLSLGKASGNTGNTEKASCLRSSRNVDSWNHMRPLLRHEKMVWLFLLIDWTVRGIQGCPKGIRKRIYGNLDNMAS